MKNLIAILMIIVAIFPKVDIINIHGMSTGIRLEDFLIAILMILIIIFYKKLNFKNNHLKKISNYFLLYFIICIGSTVLGSCLGYVKIIKGLLFVLRKFEYFIFIYFGYIYYKNNKDDKNISIFINFTVIFHLIICLLQYFGLVGSFHGGVYLGELHQGRLTSTFNGSYELSAYLIIMAIYYLYNLLFTKKNKIIDIIFLILIFICIYISKSRTSLVCFVIIIIMMLIKKYNKNFKKMFNVVIIIIIISMVGVFGTFKLNLLDKTRFSMINISGYKDTIECAWNNKNFSLYLKTGTWFGSQKCVNVGTDDSFNLRFNHWAQLFDGLKEQPLLGLGASVTTEAADGNYIRILAESGILGLIAWISLIVYIIFSLCNDNSLNIITKFTLYSLLLGALFIDVFEASKLMMIFWFMLGITLKNNEVGYDKKCNNCK